MLRCSLMTAGAESWAADQGFTPTLSKVKDPPFPKSQGPRVRFHAEGVKLALIKLSATGAMPLCLPMKKYIQKKQK